MNQQIVFKSFLVDFNAIIELCAGFDAYFEKYPEEEKDFPICNQPRDCYRKEIKSREMFIGKKTDTFTKLLNVMSIELDAAFLEAEYYLMPIGEGNIYKYTNGMYSIAFDFYIDPTAQIECCAVSISFPKDKENEMVSIIRQLQNDSVYVVKKIHDGDFNKLYEKINKQDNKDKSQNAKLSKICTYLK